MISLKKNDKIIIIVAVVILVIAGVGVAMYQSPKTESILPSTITTENSYDVVWTLKNGSLNAISDFAGKKSPYGTLIVIPEGNVNSVTFDLSWTDDHMTFFKRMGLDSLTLEVTMPDGIYFFTETNTSAPVTGAGTISKTILKDVIPPDKSIKADNERDAQSKLSMYDDSWTDKDIKINVSVQVGEKRFRILKQFFEKGNDFELKISYQYYDGVLKQDTTKNTGTDTSSPSEEDPWVEQETPPYMSMIISTGCGRYV
jgi:hypothetical protein